MLFYKKNEKRFVGNLVSLILRYGVVLAILIAISLNIDIDVIYSHLTLNLIMSVALTSIICFIANIPQVFRLSWLVAPPRPSFSDSGCAFLLAVGFNVIVPFQISHFLKATCLRERADVPFSRSIVAIAIERLADAITLSVTMLVLGGGLLSEMFSKETVWMIGAVSVGALGIIVIISRDHTSRLLIRAIPNTRARVIASTFRERVFDILGAHKLFGAVAMGAASMWIVVLGAWLLVILAGSIPLSMLDAAVLVVGAMLGAAIPSSPGGFGVYEAAAIMILMHHGYSLEEAVVLALSLHISQILLTFISSLILWSRGMSGLKSIKDLSDISM